MHARLQWLSPGLFWDVDVRQLDWRRHAKFVIRRVLAEGDVNDWQFVRRRYGLPAVRRAFRTNRGLDAKSRVFWQVVLAKKQ